MKLAVSPFALAAFAAAFVALVHCGDDDDKTPIECSIAGAGKSCECKPGRETLGFCSERVLGIPSVCCAQDGWPAADHRCTCELIVCLEVPGACKCARWSERLSAANAEEVAECTAKTSDDTRCCVDKAGNCGCYLKSADQCGEGATDVATCDYHVAAPPCATGEHGVTTCEE